MGLSGHDKLVTLPVRYQSIPYTSLFSFDNKRDYLSIYIKQPTYNIYKPAPPDNSILWEKRKGYTYTTHSIVYR